MEDPNISRKRGFLGNLLVKELSNENSHCSLSICTFLSDLRSYFHSKNVESPAAFDAHPDVSIRLAMYSPIGSKLAIPQEVRCLA